MSVSCECCVSPGGGPCENPMTCPEESYRQWYIIVCDLKLSIIKRPWPALGCRAEEKKKCTFHSVDFYETRACCTGLHKALYTEFREILIRSLVAESKSQRDSQAGLCQGVLCLGVYRYNAQ